MDHKKNSKDLSQKNSKNRYCREAIRFSKRVDPNSYRACYLKIHKKSRFRVARIRRLYWLTEFWSLFTITLLLVIKYLVITYCNSVWTGDCRIRLAVEFEIRLK